MTRSFPRSFPIVQFPNAPLIATALAAVVARATTGQTAAGARVASRLALLVWAGEEIFDGANWFRRLLGLGGAGLAVAGLVDEVSR